MEQLVDMMSPNYDYFFNIPVSGHTVYKKGRNQMTTTTRETGRQPTDMVVFFFFFGRNFTIFQQRNWGILVFLV
jgi:hypothetical protein